MISLPATPPPSLNIGSLPATTPLCHSKHERRGSLCLPPTPSVARNTEGSVLSACHHPPSVTQYRLSTCHHPPPSLETRAEGDFFHLPFHHSKRERRGSLCLPPTPSVARNTDHHPPSIARNASGGIFLSSPLLSLKTWAEGFSLCAPPPPPSLETQVGRVISFVSPPLSLEMWAERFSLHHPRAPLRHSKRVWEGSALSACHHPPSVTRNASRRGNSSPFRCQEGGRTPPPLYLPPFWHQEEGRTSPPLRLPPFWHQEGGRTSPPSCSSPFWCQEGGRTSPPLHLPSFCHQEGGRTLLFVCPHFI